MESDRAKRLTAKEVLQHPWIINGGPKAKESKLNSLKNMVSNGKEIDSNDSMQLLLTQQIIIEFANFSQSGGFKHAICVLFRDQFEQMRPEHYKSLKTLFKKLDTDGNGKISLKDFENGILKFKNMNLKKEQIESMFKELDVKNLGEIGLFL